MISLKQAKEISKVCFRGLFTASYDYCNSLRIR